MVNLFSKFTAINVNGYLLFQCFICFYPLLMFPAVQINKLKRLKVNGKHGDEGMNEDAGEGGCEDGG